MKKLELCVYLAVMCNDHPPTVCPKDRCLLFQCGKCENVSCLLCGLRGNKHLNLDILVTQESCFQDIYLSFDIFIDLDVLAILKDVSVTAV